VYIRFGRNPVPVIYPVNESVIPGRGNLLREGRHASIIAAGATVAMALEAAEILSNAGIQVSVADMVSIKPLDSRLLLHLASTSEIIVTAEDHQITGGLFGAVSEYLSEHSPTRVLPVGIKNRFGCSGTPEEVIQHLGVTARAIAEKVKKGLKAGNSIDF
jgi:transketolase